MRFDWRLMLAFLPLLAAVASCDDPPTSTTVGGGGNRSTTSSTTANSTTKLGKFDQTFGAAKNTSGQSGLVNQTNTNFGTDLQTGSLQATYNLRVNGLLPGDATDSVACDPPLDVQLVPRNALGVSHHVVAGADGKAVFANLPEGSYHYVYNDGWKIGSSQPDSQGMTHINMVGFFVSAPLEIYRAGLLNGNASASFDLYWNTASFPRTQSLYAGSYGIDSTHSNGQFISYQDAFRFREKTDITAQYRVVVYSTTGSHQIEWLSSWHKPDSTGQVEIFWNGYTGRLVDSPNETDNSALAAGSYLYALQFEEDGMTNFPDEKGDVHNYVQDSNKVLSNFYGSSQLYAFSLVIGDKTKSSPRPSPTPAPSPSPAASPLVRPTVPPPYDQPSPY